MDSPLSPARNTDLRQIVYEKIKEAIVNGIIPPGQRLSEVELADQLAVSRTPVREAIRQLAQTGLVVLIPRRGAYVALPTVQDALDLYELRSGLELIAMERACKNPPLEELQACLSIFRNATDAIPVTVFLEGDRRFHAAISAASHNRYLQEVLENISDQINLCRHYSVVKLPLGTSSLEHVTIIEAMMAGDRDKAVATLRDHLARARDALVEVLRLHDSERA
ncbi:GntR family transcriptional regulator [Aminithiophilus ramosus]|uniref:GntR family transcriptional regulator n=1 Tax=Aminithiophilus ramosus TaxID=3029084 RepID=A0A9Q7AT15_9BACT|nr:GntR family transcriptional regulator [Aminithiophilus ramosus]QTX33426.1 GntR family transcriptional regulator [Aminithiophilus ramosus]